MVKSTAVSDARLTSKHCTKPARIFFPRGHTIALEALDAVNNEIEELIKQSWGRP
jgi:chromosome partitioning protein